MVTHQMQIVLKQDITVLRMRINLGRGGRRAEGTGKREQRGRLQRARDKPWQPTRDARLGQVKLTFVDSHC